MEETKQQEREAIRAKYPTIMEKKWKKVPAQDGRLEPQYETECQGVPSKDLSNAGPLVRQEAAKVYELGNGRFRGRTDKFGEGPVEAPLQKDVWTERVYGGMAQV